MLLRRLPFLRLSLGNIFNLVLHRGKQIELKRGRALRNGRFRRRRFRRGGRLRRRRSGGLPARRFILPLIYV